MLMHRPSLIWALRLLVLIMAGVGMFTHPGWAVLGFLGLVIVVRAILWITEIAVATFGPRP